jgi:hypothetical protein
MSSKPEGFSRPLERVKNAKKPPESSGFSPKSQAIERPDG